MYQYRVIVWIKDNHLEFETIIEEKTLIISANCEAEAMSVVDYYLQFTGRKATSTIKNISKI